MDYESRHVKWYWMLAFTGFCGLTGYLLFLGNPFLYSNSELRTQLGQSTSVAMLIPETRPEAGTLPNEPFTSRTNWARTAQVKPENSFKWELKEVQNFPLSSDIKFTADAMTADGGGFILSDSADTVSSVSFEGHLRWQYRFKEAFGSDGPFSPITDGKLAYLFHPNGQVVTLSAKTGELIWSLDLPFAVAAQPFIWGEKLVAPVRDKNQIALIEIERRNGDMSNRSDKIDIKPGFLASYNESQKLMILTSDNKVVAINPEGWKLVWSQSMTDPIRGYAVNVDNTVLVSTLGAKIYKLDAKSRGRITGEIDLPKPAAGSMTYLPQMNRLNFLSTSGAMTTVDLKSEKVLWTYNIENRNPLNETWTQRLKGAAIEKFKMDWIHKGWAIWSPCSTQRICIYAPNKGALIQRIPLVGRPLTIPIQIDDTWYILVQNGDEEAFISHVGFEQTKSPIDSSPKPQ